MTHFNHEWDTTKTPAVPVSVGDRYYAQDLNDDFNYLKHLPYEAILQGRPRGVLIPPTDTWDVNNHTLTLSGGFGVTALSTYILNVNEDFAIPPKTTTDYRYERVSFPNTVLVLPSDDSVHYIVATPTKRGLLQRVKALLAEQYSSRIQYDGIISIQNTVPTTDQILVGLCHNDEYLLCKDYVLDQGVDTIKLHKWYGENKIVNAMIPILQSYYNTSVTAIETNIYIKNTHSRVALSNVACKNCSIRIETIDTYSAGFDNCTLDNCIITISMITGEYATGINVNNRVFNSQINIGSIDSDSVGAYTTVFSNTIINISTIKGTGFVNSQCLWCRIYVDTVDTNALARDTLFNSTAVNISTIKDPNATGSSPTCKGFVACTMIDCFFYIVNVDHAVAFDACNCYSSFLEIVTMNTEGRGVRAGLYTKCHILIHETKYYTYGILGACTLRNCTIEFYTIYYSGVNSLNSHFDNCCITMNEVKSGTGIIGGIFSNCTIIMGSVESGAYSIADSSALQFYFVMCTLPSIPTLSHAVGKGLVINNVTVISF